MLPANIYVSHKVQDSNFFFLSLEAILTCVPTKIPSFFSFQAVKLYLSNTFENLKFLLILL